MTERSLQVTYRKGRTFAAYLHLSHPTGEKSARTVAASDGLLIVDYTGSGRPLGVEITAPQGKLLWTTAALFAISVTIGAALASVVYLYPVRFVRVTEQHIAEMITRQDSLVEASRVLAATLDGSPRSRAACRASTSCASGSRTTRAATSSCTRRRASGASTSISVCASAAASGSRRR